MKVHTSNYSIEGFYQTVEEAEPAEVGELDIPVVAADLGGGSLRNDLSQYDAEPCRSGFHCRRRQSW